MTPEAVNRYYTLVDVKECCCTQCDLHIDHSCTYGPFECADKGNENKVFKLKVKDNPNGSRNNRLRT